MPRASRRRARRTAAYQSRGHRRLSPDPRRGRLGILNNPAYVGRVVWNRSQKVRDPDTGKRLMRPRPESEWPWVEQPEPRIVPDELWEQARSRRAERRVSLTGGKQGARPS